MPVKYKVASTDRVHASVCITFAFVMSAMWTLFEDGDQKEICLGGDVS
jgi:hypothetical protein